MHGMQNFRCLSCLFSSLVIIIFALLGLERVIWLIIFRNLLSIVFSFNHLSFFRLGGNPICKNQSGQNTEKFCKSNSVEDGLHRSSSSSSKTCPVSSCPTDSYFELVPDTPDPCFCASPLGIGYRLKSPSFSYFPPYMNSFEAYLSKELSLVKHQLLIDSYDWEGSRLRMYLKIFPSFDSGTHKLDVNETFLITEKFMSWNFTRNDVFGPYELLNFTIPDRLQTGMYFVLWFSF